MPLDSFALPCTAVPPSSPLLFRFFRFQELSAPFFFFCTPPGSARPDFFFPFPPVYLGRAVKHSFPLFRVFSPLFDERWPYSRSPHPFVVVSSPPSQFFLPRCDFFNKFPTPLFLARISRLPCSHTVTPLQAEPFLWSPSFLLPSVHPLRLSPPALSPQLVYHIAFGQHDFFWHPRSPTNVYSREAHFSSDSEYSQWSRPLPCLRIEGPTHPHPHFSRPFFFQIFFFFFF